MFWAGVAIATVLLGVVGLLAMPVRLSVRVERADRTRATWRVRWLAGLVDVRTGRRKRSRRAPPPGKPARAARKTPLSRRWSRGLAAAAMLRTRGFVRRVARLAIDMVRRVHWEEFSLRADFGLDDPADTGRLYGLLAPLLLVATANGLDVQCRPIFLRPGLEGSCAATLRVRPLSIAGVTLLFACSPVLWRALVRAARARR